MDDSAVIYESPHVSLARRVALSLVFGAVPPALGAWWRWVAHRGLAPSPLHIALGVFVSVAMLWAALRSCTVYRVVLTERALHVHRDPGVVETFELSQVTARSVPAEGGWSRSPAERLEVRTSDGLSRSFTLPDDAHTPGIVDDIARVQAGAPLASLFDPPEAPR